MFVRPSSNRYQSLALCEGSPVPTVSSSAFKLNVELTELEVDPGAEQTQFEVHPARVGVVLSSSDSFDRAGSFRSSATTTETTRLLVSLGRPTRGGRRHSSVPQPAPSQPARGCPAAVQLQATRPGGRARRCRRVVQKLV